MAEMTQEELVQEVLDRVLQSSTGVEDLETVTSLSGVKSLPGEKDGKMVNVPLELIGSLRAMPLLPAPPRRGRAAGGRGRPPPAAGRSGHPSPQGAAAAEDQATGSGPPPHPRRRPPATEPGGRGMYVADAGKFAYHMDSTLYGDWDVAGVPPAGIFMNADRTAILPDKLYLLGDAVYTGTGGSLRLLAYRHEVMSGEAYEALQDKDANTLYLIYEED